MHVPRGTAVLLAASLIGSACAPVPSIGPTAHPSGGPVSEPSLATPGTTTFAASAWPETGSACGAVGYRGSLGRVEALDTQTVRFTLCSPDGAFLAKTAHPTLGIVPAAALDRIASDPSSAAFVTGSGAWQIEARAGDNVRLVPAPGVRIGATTALILRWDHDAAARTALLLDATVDGVDAPAASSLDDLSTMPEIALLPRASLAVAYLGFGDGAAFAAAAIRRAIGEGLDPSRLLAAFPPGSSAAAHLAPCTVASGCAGTAFPGYNGAAGAAALDAAPFDRSKTYPLHLPDAPIPGLPDPAAAGAAIAAQLAAVLGVQVGVDPMPASVLRAAIADGTIDGLYVDAVASPVADAAAFYTALYADRPNSAAARRAGGIVDKLAAVAAVTDPADRTAALTAISNTARSSAGLVPLVSTGAMTAWRTDVAGAVASPLGADPLGAMTAGDRGQVVFLQAASAGGGWCGASETADAWRLCALISDGLYALPPGATTPLPRLASACAPSEDATVWTCRLRAGLRTGDGETLDAHDVLATFRAAWDATSPARAASGGTGETWTGLFGGLLNPPPAP